MTPRARSVVSERRLRWGITSVAFITILLVALVLAFLVRETAPLFWSAKVQLSSLLWPRQWPGYEAAAFVWQPVGAPPKLNLVALFAGTLKTTTIAMLISTPVAVLAAVLSLPVALVGAEEKKKGGGFAAMDTDKDGKVSKKEYVAAQKDATKAESRFAQLDADKDGFLTQAEMAAGQKKKNQ